MKVKKTAIIITIVIALFMVVYFMFDPETKKLDKKEREKLGGTYIELSNGFTHYKLAGSVDGKLVILVHGGTIPIDQM